MTTTWIQSSEGKAVFPLTLQPEQVGSIEEIARTLSRRFRFSGQTRDPYSVAEHCVRGADLLPPALGGAFLLHELSEVYLPDVPAPVKPHLRVLIGDGPLPWDHLEASHTRAILQSLRLAAIEPLIYSPEVRRMDLAMLAAEREQLLGPEPMPWGLTVPAAPVQIHAWNPVNAEAQFVARFRYFFGAK